MIEEPLDASLELGAERRDLTPDRAEARAGAVRQPSVGIEGLAKSAGEVGKVGQIGPDAAEPGGDDRDPLAIRTEPGRGGETVPEEDQGGTVQDRACWCRLGQDRAGITRPVPWRRPLGRQGPARLGRLPERVAHGGQGMARHERPSAVLPRGRRRKASEQVTKGVPSQEVVADQLHLDRPTSWLVRVALPSLGLLASRQRLALPPDARLLVMLALFQLGEEPRLLALLLEALERALEGLVRLHDDLRHVRVPPSVLVAWVNE